MPGQQSFYQEIRESFQDSLEKFRAREVFPRPDIRLNQLPSDIDTVRGIVNRNIARIRDGFFPAALRVDLKDLWRMYRKSEYKNRPLNYVSAEYVVKTNIFQNLCEVYGLESPEKVAPDDAAGFVLLNRQQRFLVATAPHGEQHIRAFNYLLPSGGYDELDDTFQGRLTAPLEVGKHVRISRTDEMYQRPPLKLSRVRKMAVLPASAVQAEIAQKLRLVMDAIRFMNP